MSRPKTRSAGSVPFPDPPPARLLTRTGPIAGPHDETVWERRGGKYHAPGHDPATFAQLVRRFDQVRRGDL
jgi:hypothetical protein